MKRLLCLFAAACLAAFSAAPALAAQASEAPGAKPLAVGSAFPDVTLVGELTPEAAASLGLAPGAARVSLDSLGPEVLVLEVFSMYCPFCQQDAPSVNALNDLIAKRGLSNRIAVVGVGAGNSVAEVEVFRKKFAVPFPLFADPDFVVHGRVGKVGTPFFYVLRKKPGGGYVVAGASLGVMDSPAEFLSRITRAAGI